MKAEKEKLKKKKTNAKIEEEAQRDEDDSDYDAEIEDEKRMSKFSESARSVKDYDINFHLKDNEAPSLILYKYRWIVLFAYFLSSTATGAVQGSLSENRAIIDKIDEFLPDVGS